MYLSLLAGVNFPFSLFFFLPAPSGGEYDGDRKMDDLKLLYRAYVTDSLSGGRMEKDKVDGLISISFIASAL